MIKIFKVKHLIRSSRMLMYLSSCLYRLFGSNRICKHGNANVVKTNVPSLFLSNSQFKVCGNGNTIIFRPGNISHIRNLNVSIVGDNNVLEIGAGASIDGFTVCMEDNNNSVVMGTDFRSGYNTELAVIEGTSIIFGDDCMLSANITIRTGDSHSVIDLDGKRINFSKSVIIGDHTWIGNTVLILKGAEIAHNSIVAGGSIVTGKTFPANCIIGGNPAKVIKEGVDWLSERI